MDDDECTCAEKHVGDCPPREPELWYLAPEAAEALSVPVTVVREHEPVVFKIRWPEEKK